MQKRWLKLAAVPVALGLVAAACGDDDDSDSSDSTEAAGDDSGDAEAMDFDGAEVTITGSERDDPSVAAINDTLNEHFNPMGLTVTFAGDADWEANINTQVQGGNPPNISFFPQPGKLADFAREGFVVEVTPEVVAAAEANYAQGFVDFGVVDGANYGVPTKTDLKGIVFYKPALFEADGYEVPETFEEFQALVEEMAAADGPAPLCVGIESGTATGWMFTDWTEDMVLRQHGGDVYDGWVTNEVAFDDERIIESMATVVDLWTDDNVFAPGGTISATNFGAPVAEAHLADDCYMVRHSNFFAGLYPAGTTFADPDDPDAIDVFYFPDINGDGPVLSAGTIAAAFDDDKATMAVMEYLASSDYAQTRQEKQTAELEGSISGYLSAAQGQDQSVYQPLEQQFLQILTTADFVRFDGGDLMPADVGAGSFWSEGTSLVNGDITVEEAAANIQATWPS
ncbi:MAG: ABC transporter substrate-binding protein [Actinomycetota bacterium]